MDDLMEMRREKGERYKLSQSFWDILRLFLIDDEF